MFSALKVTLNFRKMALISKKRAYTEEAPPLPIKYLILLSRRHTKIKYFEKQQLILYDYKKRIAKD